MSAQFVLQGSTATLNSIPKYTFLLHPPPQKKRPAQLPPSTPSQPAASDTLNTNPSPSPEQRKRSPTFSTIISWVSSVQPGSPAPNSPNSPHRRSSVSSTRRPSITLARRPSLTPVHGRAPTGSFLNILDTPSTARKSGTGATPSIGDFKGDLTTVGYTSVFVHLPNTPVSAAISLPGRAPHATVEAEAKKLPVPPVSALPQQPGRALTSFRSLSALRTFRTRGRSKSTSHTVAMPAAPTLKTKTSSSSIVKKKKAKYSAVRPAPLANDLELMQFLDGGSMDSNIKRLMEAQGKAAAGKGRLAGGISDVYRDGEGGIWWDQDEEWEYAHLLAGNEADAHATGDKAWVTFSEAGSPRRGVNLIQPAEVVDSGSDGGERRGSVSTQDSDLDMRYLVQPTDHLDADDLAVFGSALVPLALRKPAMSVLSVPARPRRTAKHLRKPEYLVDLAFPRSPVSPKSPTAKPISAKPMPKPKGKARRRPAPLTLSPPTPTMKKPINSPVDTQKIRNDFIENSFDPPVPTIDDAKPRAVTAINEAQRERGRLMSAGRKLNVLPHNGASVSSVSLSLPAKKSSKVNFSVVGLFKSSKKL